MKRFAFVFVVLALAVASAKTYSVTLFQPSMVGGTELQPGDYKVDVQDAKVVIKSGKTSVESAVTVETGDQKFNATSVRYTNGDGKYRVQEIRLGGTNTKLVFEK
ncbi:MAG TPA: hypothetical protein VN428_14390 [Bryobacteraceae bacterium]|nr:hypothetical protein [Bryobacteraceae bacterium]